MRFRFLLITALLALALLAMVIPTSAQINNPQISITCNSIRVDGTAGVSGTLFINVDNGAVNLVAFSQASVVVGQSLGIQIPFTQQPQGTSLNYFVQLGSFFQNQTVACAGPFAAEGIGDGRLNAYDAAAPIAVYCANGGVSIVNIVNSQASGGVIATAGQVANGLAAAIASRQNVQIVGSGATSLWALSSNELQAVFRGTTNYDFVFSPRRCGITAASTTSLVTATPVGTPIGTIPGLVYGPTVGTGVVPPTTGGACVAPTGARAAHVVRTGENLFRIGLRYGVDFRVIASYNGIANPALIYVGQCILIP